MKSTWEFTIRVDHHNDGSKTFHPMARFCRYKWWKPNWERITKIYDQYILCEYHNTALSSMEIANDHIEGFKKQIIHERIKNVKESVYTDTILFQV